MKEFDYSNLDPESRQQLQFIHLKEAVEALESLIEPNGKYVASLEQRIEVLEEARKRQIEINSELLAKKVPVKEVKSFWPWRR